MSQPARVLEGADVRRLLRHVRGHRYAARDHAMILLSFKAGLRACEIAGLDWSMILRPDGQLDRHIAVARQIAKNGSARRVPLHPELKVALLRLHGVQARPRSGAVIPSERGGRMKPRSVVNWFRATYAKLGLAGCSSHSGRRTFITRSARLLARTGGSLRDVQELAGHRSLTTTERPFASGRLSRVATFAMIESLIRRGQPVLVSIEGAYSHYSVIAGVSATSFRLFDSNGLARITRDACGIGTDQRTRRYWLDTRALMTIETA